MFILAVNKKLVVDKQKKHTKKSTIEDIPATIFARLLVDVWSVAMFPAHRTMKNNV